MSNYLKLPEKELASFVEAIQANPQDQAPRLAFSDWLAEHNHPRAEWVRGWWAWKWMMPDVRDPIPELIEALGGDPRTNLDAELALNEIGTPAMPAIRKWVQENPDQRWPRCRDLLTKTRPPRLQSVPKLIKKFEEGTWYEIWQAAVDLGFHGPKAAAAVDVLMEPPERDEWEDFFHQYEVDPLWNAIYTTLGEIGPAAKKHTAILAQTAWFRGAAGNALVKIGADPYEVLEHVNTDGDSDTRAGLRIVKDLDETKTSALSYSLTHYHYRKRYCAAELLGDMGSEAADAVPALIEAVETAEELERDTVEYHVTIALGKIGEAAREAIPLLRKMLKNPSSSYLPEAIETTLIALGEPAAIPIAKKKLKANSQEEQMEGIEMLGRVARHCDQADAELLTLLKSRSQPILEKAAEVVATLMDGSRDGPSLVPFIEPMLRLLKDTSEVVRESAGIALTRFMEKATDNSYRIPGDLLEEIRKGLE